MSGALSTIGNVVSAARGLAEAFGLSGVITLGDFTFQGFEVPERIGDGGQHQQTVHRLAGGARVIDMMGPDDRPIEWTGTFLGADAWERAGQLDQMRDDGEVLDLTYGTVSRQVVIADLSLDRSFSRVDYRVSCTVLPSDGAPREPGLLDSITSDLGSALGIDLPATMADVSSGLAVAQKALSAVSPLVPGASNALALAGSLTSGVQLAGAAVNSAGSVLRGVSSLSSAGSVGSMLGAAESLAKGTAVGAFLGRASTNAVGGLY